MFGLTDPYCVSASHGLSALYSRTSLHFLWPCYLQHHLVWLNFERLSIGETPLRALGSASHVHAMPADNNNRLCGCTTAVPADWCRFL